VSFQNERSKFCPALSSERHRAPAQVRAGQGLAQVQVQEPREEQVGQLSCRRHPAGQAPELPYKLHMDNFR